MRKKSRLWKRNSFFLSGFPKKMSFYLVQSRVWLQQEHTHMTHIYIYMSEELIHIDNCVEK